MKRIRRAQPDKADLLQVDDFKLVGLSQSKTCDTVASARTNPSPEARMRHQLLEAELRNHARPRKDPDWLKPAANSAPRDTILCCADGEMS